MQCTKEVDIKCRWTNRKLDANVAHVCGDATIIPIRTTTATTINTANATTPFVNALPTEKS